MKKYKLEIVAYDASWPQMYQTEKEVLSRAVNRTDVVFEHIGATSIPGLAGKPIIDISIGMEDFSQSHELVKVIQSIGYYYEPDLELEIPDFKFLWKGEKLGGDHDFHTHHISIKPINSNSWKHPLAFRDYLRKHPQEALKYSKLKKELAKRYAIDNASYARAKSSFVKTIIRKALESKT